MITRSPSLGLKLSKMGQFWKREFTGNLLTLVCYYITKVMQMYVTKNPLSKQCCTVQNLCHLQMNITNRNAANCVQYSLVLVTHSASSTALIIKNFDHGSPARGQDSTTTDKIVRINIPFKDQKSTSAVRKQLKELTHKINVTIQPIFTSRKLEKDLIKPKEKKPDLVNQNCVVYVFKCDLCDADYVGMTTRHLHQCIVEHKYSSIGNHFREHHDSLLGLKSSQFYVLKKCSSKFNCLVYEMLFIRKLKPSLNVQCDIVFYCILFVFSYIFSTVH